MPKENNIKPNRILVVDDREYNHKLLGKYFSDSEYSIDYFLSAELVIEKLYDGEIYDLAIIDVMMPGLDGYKLCEIIREQYNMFELPVLFLTGKSEPDDMVEAFRAGGNDFVAKPYRPQELIARAKTLLKLKNLYSTNRNLQAELVEKNSFIQMNVHDLKNPLTSIMALGTLLEEHVGKAGEGKELLDIIMNSASFINTLVNQILDISILDSENYKMRKEEVDMNLLVSQTVDYLNPLAKSKNQKIVFKRSEAERCLVSTDPEKMVQVLGNILSNAIKYSPKNSPIEASVSISNFNSDSVARVEIVDYGPGFTEEDKRNMFNKFVKLSARPTAGESSTGLGLVVAKKFVELNGGSLSLVSKPGIGSRFIIEIPIANGGSVCLA